MWRGPGAVRTVNLEVWRAICLANPICLERTQGEGGKPLLGVDKDFLKKTLIIRK